MTPNIPGIFKAMKSKIVIRLKKRTKEFKGFHGAHNSKKSNKRQVKHRSWCFAFSQSEMLKSQHFLVRELGSADWQEEKLTFRRDKDAAISVWQSGLLEERKEQVSPLGITFQTSQLMQSSATQSQQRAWGISGSPTCGCLHTCRLALVPALLGSEEESVFLPWLQICQDMGGSILWQLDLYRLACGEAVVEAVSVKLSQWCLPE